MPDVIQIVPPRVALIDSRTGAISREWYLFLLYLFKIQGDHTSAIDFIQRAPSSVTIDDVLKLIPDQIGTSPTSNYISSALDELRKQILAIESQPRQETGTFASLNQSGLPWTTFDTTSDSTPGDIGTVAWDGGTTLGVQMTPNVLGKVNESGYYYIKASAAITKGQVVMFTGAVGASGVPTGAPATGITDGTYIMGIAAETLAINSFGLVQFIGTLRGIDTSSFVDGDVLWYNSAIAGGLTKVKPSAPNIKVQVAAVISATNNGTILVRVTTGSELGGTDSNVQIASPSTNDLLQYDGALGYWKNVPLSGVSVGTTTNLASGAAGSIPYQSGPDVTTMLPIGAGNQYLKVNSGGTAPQWSSPAALTGASDTNVTVTLGGSSSTALLNAASITMGWTGTLSVTRGGTGNSVFAVGDLMYASTTTTISKLGIGATDYILASSGTAPQWSAVTGTGSVVRASGPVFTAGLGVGGTTAPSSGSGVKFPATQSASTDANTLDDYEEGTWTPVLDGSTTSPTVTYTLQRGEYVKIGKMVQCSVYMSWSAFSGGSGSIYISLPFASNGSVGTLPSGAIGYFDGFTLGTRTFASVQVVHGTQYARVTAMGGGLTTTALATTAITGSGIIAFNVCYQATA